MDTVPRGSDGRRLFTAEFKRQQIDRVLRGELSVTELSRELSIGRRLIQRWKHLATAGAEMALGWNGAVVPVGELRAAQARIKELERLIGKQTVELEILKAARDGVKKGRTGTACRNRDGKAGRADLPDAGDPPCDSISGS
jgi:transposase